MNYYRKPLNKVVDDVKLKIQLGALTLKISENNNKIDDLIGVDKNIKKDVSSNTSKIDAYKTSLNLINTNTTNNSNDISNNLTKINEIKADLSNIDFDSNNKYSIENFFIYNIEIEKNYKLNKDKNSFSIFKYTLEDDFKKDSILEIDCRLLYRYIRYNDIGFLQHIFKLYDDTYTMLYHYKSLKTNSGDNLSNDLKQNDVFCVKLDDDYDVIKIELILSLIDNVNNTVDCKIYNTYNSNFSCIKYYEKTNLISVYNNLGDLENTILSKIEKNKGNISSNLINMRISEDNIAINLSKINNIRNSIYLKNIYNILFYDEKTQVDFRNLFFEKIFSIDSKQNDFIEINLKMLLEYENINEKNYVSSIYEIFDKNNNSFYISTINNNDYQYFSNKVFVEENFFIISQKMLKI